MGKSNFLLGGLFLSNAMRVICTVVRGYWQGGASVYCVRAGADWSFAGATFSGHLSLSGFKVSGFSCVR